MNSINFRGRAVALLLGGFLWGSEASAETSEVPDSVQAVDAGGDPTSVAFLPLMAAPEISAAAAEEFSKLLSAELEKRDVLKAPEPVPPPLAKPNPLSEGRTLLANLRFSDAEASFKRALEGMWEEPATIEREQLLNGQLLLAVSAFRAGEERKAKDALLTLLRMDANFVLPEGQYPPVFARELEKARRRVEGGAHGTVSIQGPAGSVAYLDGRLLGPVPVKETGVPTGTHFLRFEGDNGELYGQPLQLLGASAEVRALFPRGPHRPESSAQVLEGTLLDFAAAGRAEVLCGDARVEQLMLGVVFRPNPKLLAASLAIYSVHTKGFQVVAPMYFDGDLKAAHVEARQLAEQLTARVKQPWSSVFLPYQLANTRLLLPPEAVSKAPVQMEATEKNTSIAISEEPLFLRRIPVWVWVVAGAGVAGAAAGTAVAISAANRPVAGQLSAHW